MAKKVAVHVGFWKLFTPVMHVCRNSLNLFFIYVSGIREFELTCQGFPYWERGGGDCGGISPTTKILPNLPLQKFCTFPLVSPSS